jgi:hypothetical protein
MFIVIMLSVLILLISLFITFISLRLRYELKLLKLYYSDEFRKPLLQKFYDFIDDLRVKENVYLKIHDDILSLNNIDEESKLKDNSVVGIYTYLKPEFNTEEKRKERNLPRIEIKKGLEEVWVYAHELGHHFAITKESNHSEEKADNYIKIFAEQCFNEEELSILKSTIEIYSKEKLDIEDGYYKWEKKQLKKRFYV